MGTYLYLVLPKNKITDYSIIDDYIKFRETKRIKYSKIGLVKATVSELKSNIPTMIKIIKESSKSLGKVFIYEQVFSDLADTKAWESLSKGLLHEAYISDEILYKEKIKQLITGLRNCKEELKASAEDQEGKNFEEVSIETSVISICEFALKKGFGIRYSS